MSLKVDLAIEDRCKMKKVLDFLMLILSNKQAIKAQEILIRGMLEIDSMQLDIRARESQIERIKLTRIAPDAQKAQIDAVRAEINNLNAGIYEIYRESVSDFEAMLTKKQLEKYKELS